MHLNPQFPLFSHLLCPKGAYAWQASYASHLNIGPFGFDCERKEVEDGIFIFSLWTWYHLNIIGSGSLYANFLKCLQVNGNACPTH